MAATLVKASVLVLMGALIVPGARLSAFFDNPWTPEDALAQAGVEPLVAAPGARLRAFSDNPRTPEDALAQAGAELLVAWPNEPTLNLGAGTWSGNMGALLHKYIVGQLPAQSQDRAIADEHFNKVASWSLMEDGTGFDKRAWGNATVANQEIEDAYSGSLESLRNLWYARQRYLKVAAEIMEHRVKSATGLDVRIFATGSSRLTSDQDVQIAMNLCKPAPDENQPAPWTTSRIRVLADVVIWIRHVSSSIVALPGSDDTSIVLEELYDINFYPPTLFNYLPNSCKDRFQEQFYYEGDGDTIAFHVFLGSRLTGPGPLAPNQIDTDNLAFLKTEGFRATRNFDVTNTPLFLDRWKSTTAPKLEKLLLFAQVSTSEPSEPRTTRATWNSMMLDMTFSNVIGPEMYLTISSILYVAWNMQMGEAIDEEVLPKFGIVATIENLVHYKHTSKEKYRLRVCDPYNRYLSPRYNGGDTPKAFYYFRKTFEHIKAMIEAERIAAQHLPGEETQHLPGDDIFDPVAVEIVNEGLEALVDDIESVCRPPLV